MADEGLTLFGWEFRRKKEKEPESFVTKSDDDGALDISVAAGGGAYATYVDLDGAARTEAELITKYRELALQAEIDYAIDEIINEVIAIDEDDVVTVNTDKLTDISEPIKNKIQEEFDNIKEVLDINNIAYQLLRRFYIDGRLKFHVLIDDNNTKNGVKEMRYIDPRKLRKIREIIKEEKDGATIYKTKAEYYIYNERGFDTKTKGTTSTNVGGLKITKDAIIDVSSGLMNENNTLVLSHLHKAIKPMNQLRTLEDANIIYYLSRAPERRVFYIDTGNLPKAKAEQYIRDMITKHKNKLVYDASSGQIRDDRKHMTMLEDYWLPRRGENQRGTEISSISGGANLGDMVENINYFLQRLYRSLNIPISRIEQGQGFTIGRSSEITRDELKFQKFINRIRKTFSQLFYDALEKQLILKKIITPEEWPIIKNKIFFEFAIDNHFTEMKNMDLMLARAELANMLEPYAGKYMSHETIRKDVFQQTEEDIKEEDKKIKGEENVKQFNPDLEDMDFGGGGFGAPTPQAAPKPEPKPTPTANKTPNSEI